MNPESSDPRLEADLDRAYAGLRLPASPPFATYRQLQAKRLSRKPLAGLMGLPALLGTKAVAAAAVVTLAGTAVGVKAAVTGSPDPTNWGQQVTQQVKTCKAQLQPGQHGIGECVSDFANQHGKQVSAAHSQAGANSHANSHASGAPTGSPSPGDHGQPSSPPHPTPGSGHSGTHPGH